MKRPEAPKGKIFTARSRSRDARGHVGRDVLWSTVCVSLPARGTEETPARASQYSEESEA